jgi:hypothetical protein
MEVFFMSDKQRFSFFIRSDERRILKILAAIHNRSEGATLRLLIRSSARELLNEAETPNTIIPSGNFQAAQDG